MPAPQPIKIAINALGGQGGGVLANWIIDIGERAGYIAQATSVPGVAQRTGATVYYIELFPEHAAEGKGKKPVLALMPIPGDIDIVLAAELMEAGRAIARGFVSKKTTLIASSHRDYAISEKIALGDGRQNADSVTHAAEKCARRFTIGDMQAAAESTGAVISAVMLGALAGSGALPIPRGTFEDAIRDAGRAVEKNLNAFAKGWEMTTVSGAAASAPQAPAPSLVVPSSRGAASLLERMKQQFPAPTHQVLFEGLKRVVDFQDLRYGGLYLDRMQAIHALDREKGGERRNWRLAKSVAKHLALWMAYDDAIRIADLKTRASRFSRFREDVRAGAGQIVHVSEYLHPRAEEICDLLPAPLALGILSTPPLRSAVNGVFGGERRISTTKLRGFLVLNLIASLRFLRRASYRYEMESSRIANWLALIESTAARDYALACEVAALQRLIKGYGETHQRGLANYARLVGALDAVMAQPDPAAILAMLRDAALADEHGAALRSALPKLEQPGVAA